MCKNFIEMCLCELGQILFKCQVNINGIFTEKNPQSFSEKFKTSRKFLSTLNGPVFVNTGVTEVTYSDPLSSDSPLIFKISLNKITLASLKADKNALMD